MKSNLFDVDDIKTFNWSDLNGKTLRIGVSDNKDGLSVVGRDDKTGVVYVLITDVKPEE